MLATALVGISRSEGAFRTRSRLQAPAGWTERDDMTGQFTTVKADGKPFNGVRREHPAWNK